MPTALRAEVPKQSVRADDGCGNPCATGSCPGSQERCLLGKCVCQPDCANKTCGASDGCGGKCTTGACGNNQTCNNGVCQCVDVSCYGTCCGLGDVCRDGSCCTPQCSGMQCGTDPVCGTSCGTCPAGAKCVDNSRCKLGPEWERVTSPAEAYAYYNGVHGNSAKNIWAVGRDGLIARYDGKAWSLVAPLTKQDLNGVSVHRDGTAVAVGDYGTLLEYDGTAWGAVSLQGSSGKDYTGSFEAVWTAYDGTVFVAGFSRYASSSTVFRRRNGVWSELKARPSMRVRGICGSSASNVWMVGSSTSVQQRKVARYTGGTSFDGPALDFADARCGSSSSDCELFDCWSAGYKNVWAVGGRGGAFQFDGTAWTKKRRWPLLSKDDRYLGQLGQRLLDRLALGQRPRGPCPLHV
jgi:hypothetical protein